MIVVGVSAFIVMRRRRSAVPATLARVGSAAAIRPTRTNVDAGVIYRTDAGVSHEGDDEDNDNVDEITVSLDSERPAAQKSQLWF